MLSCRISTKKITENKTKHSLVENELNKLKTFDSSFGKNYFENDGMQSYLVFQPMNKYLKFNPKTGLLSKWESKGLFNKIIKPPDTTLLQCQDLKMMEKDIFYLEEAV